MFSKIKNFIFLIFFWIIYPLCYISPRSKKIWVFKGWQRSAAREIFSDNAKYLFLEVANNHPDIKAIWICDDNTLANILRKRGYRGYCKYSLQGIYYLLRARFIILSAVMPNYEWCLTGGSLKIQIWHGDGIKNMKLPSNNDPVSINKIKMKVYTPGLFVKAKFYISSSVYTAKEFIIPSFKINPEDVFITGLPRYDVLLHEIIGADIDIHKEMSDYLTNIEDKAQRIILYAPTFRRGQGNENLLANLHLDKLNKYLKDRDYYFLISLHPKFSQLGWKKNTNYTNIIFVEPGWDKYPLLNKIDMIVTDYSSSFFEFLYMDKACVFYAFDHDEYSEKQGLHQAIWESLPGKKVYNFEDLIDTLDQPIKTLTSNNKKAASKFFAFQDSNSSKRIVNQIKNI